MASRTPRYDGEQKYGNSSNLDTISQIGGRARGAHTTTDGDGCLGDGGDGGDDDDDEPSMALVNDATISCNEIKYQKRKKPKKKKKRKATTTLKQTCPPRVLLSELYPNGHYPEGELQSYTKVKTAAAEARIDDRLLQQDDTFFQNYRQAAEAHRTARKWVLDTVKPGQTTLSIAEGIEDSVRSIIGHDGLHSGDSLKAGMGFPTGICLNNQVAHYTPNPEHKDVYVQAQDTITVDFGVHINGWIIDSAFTMAFDPVHDGLLAAVRDATNSGIKAAGIDVRICEVSAAIQEAMESHEVEYNGKVYQVKPVRNLSAHSINQWHIHGSKSIPFVKNNDQTKMEEGEVFAIETFGTTGRGRTFDDVGIYGYGLNEDKPLSSSLPLESAKRLHKTIRDNFGTIVFCRRYLDRIGLNRYLAGMNCLVSHGIVESYGPLADIPGSQSAQFEHTLILRENYKEVLSRGDDY